MNLDASVSTISHPWDCPAMEIRSLFWQQWQQHREILYRCCIKWMGGNLTDAEDALSRAMLRAWEKVQKYAGKIENFKAWLTSLTHNLCVDIHRERRRGADRVEDIEGYASSEEPESLLSEDTPLDALESDEKKIVIRRAIDNLPTRQRETFILHFYGGLSYQEIAQQQEISYDNVCKRISQARKILRKELRGYFLGEEETEPEQMASSTSESEIGEISQGNGGVKPIVGETVSLSEVESVREEAMDVEDLSYRTYATTLYIAHHESGDRRQFDWGNHLEQVGFHFVQPNLHFIPLAGVSVRSACSSTCTIAHFLIS